MIEFRGWPKIARLFRDCVITEKIDGTNAAIGIQVVPHGVFDSLPATYGGLHQNEDGKVDGSIAVYAQSRKRLITPDADNHGFAAWVWANADALVQVLGEGLHFGEWWGNGIQRGYGLPKGEKRFSLFNTTRWAEHKAELSEAVPELRVVPVLYEGLFSTNEVDWAKNDLRKFGSHANAGFMNPEGVVVYHPASNTMFKSTLENDEVPKEVAMRQALRLAA